MSTIELPSFTRRNTTELTDQLLAGMDQLIEALADEQPAKLLNLRIMLDSAIDKAKFPKLNEVSEPTSINDSGEYPRLVCPYDDCGSVASNSNLQWVGVMDEIHYVRTRCINFEDTTIEYDTGEGRDDNLERTGYLICTSCGGPVSEPFGWSLDIQ